MAKPKARKKWRFYADNNIESHIIDHLRGADFDVLAVSGRPGAQNSGDGFHYEQARQLDRYLLTHDDDFWDDRRFPLRQSPGVVILPKDEEGQAKYFPVLLRKIIERDYNIDNGPRHLHGSKIRLTWDGMTHKAALADGTVQASETFSWVDLGYKRKGEA
jgi:predicted nuclease of predicted toxin-antitoxin system